MKTLSNLYEGTKYDKQASKILSDSGLFNEETSQQIIDALFRQDIHAFVHSPSWLEKYLKGIARMIVEEAQGDPNKAQQFLAECPEVFDRYLTWVKANREKIGNSLDDKFIKDMHFKDVKDELEKIQAELDAKSKEELASMDFGGSSHFSIVPIKNFGDFNDKYGGHWTGDGSSDKYAGGGGTAWCHTNSHSTYNAWTSKGEKFFVLQNDNWQNIPFNAESNEANPKDDYGNSLIAIRTDRYGRLQNATLRCNHVGVSSNADNQYETYAELSKVAGFNVEEEIGKYFENISDVDIESDMFEIEMGVVLGFRSGYADETHIKIPEGVTTIGQEAFFGNRNIVSVSIPSSVKVIEDYAFNDCSNLTEVEFSEGLETIGEKAFAYCHNIKLLALPESLKAIGKSAFSNTGLIQLNIPDSVEQIGSNLFQKCPDLTDVYFSFGAIEIPKACFALCEKLERVIGLNNIKEIKEYAFKGCHSLQTFSIPETVSYIGDSAFEDCTALNYVGWHTNNLSTIPESCFEGCTSLDFESDQRLPSSIHYIDQFAFSSCGIRHLDLSNLRNLKKIDGFAFGYNDNLTTVKLPAVEELNYNAFDNCPIEKVRLPSDTNEKTLERITSMLSNAEVETYKGDNTMEENKQKDVVFDSDEEPEDGHFADDKTDLDFEDDIDEDDILVEEEPSYTTKDLALAVVELFDSDTYDWDTGVYEDSEQAIDNLGKLKIMAQMTEEDWDSMWEDSNWSILQKFIEDHPSNAEEIFNAVASAFGFGSYEDYKNYSDWSDEDYQKFADMVEATNPSAIASVPAKHDKIDLLDDDEDWVEDDVLDEI